MRIITLTTDFGLADPFVGVMKGVILSIAPEARMVDLTHEIPAQDILAGALALESAVDYFPVGTIHLAVVDPGVGSERRAIAPGCAERRQARHAHFRTHLPRATQARVRRLGRSGSEGTMVRRQRFA